MVVCNLILLPLLAITSFAAEGSVVPIPILPVSVILILSVTDVGDVLLNPVPNAIPALFPPLNWMYPIQYPSTFCWILFPAVYQSTPFPILI